MAKNIALALYRVKSVYSLHLLFVCCLQIFAQTTASGQTLYAIVCADDGTRDNRQLDRAADIRGLKELMNNIATYAGLTPKITLFTGAQFTTAQANAAVRNINPGSQDIVFFYYNGHGGNEQADRWPSLGFNDNLYRLSLIHNTLCNTNAKLVISVGDCCNNFMTSPYSFLSDGRSSANGANLSQNYKALFRNFSGRKGIIISASSQGQVSWSLSNGALFGTSFRRALYEAVESNTPPTWEYILGRAKNLVVQTKPQQVPQYEIKEIVATGGGYGGGGTSAPGPQPPTQMPQFPPTPPPSGPQPPPFPSAPGNLVRISVFDELGPNQATEWMQINICGASQVLNLDLNSARSQQAYFAFNNSGYCTYTLSCRTLYYSYNAWGQMLTNWVNGYGTGQIYIQPNKQYVVTGQLFGSNLLLSIQEKK